MSFDEFTTSLFITILIQATDFHRHEERIPLAETSGCQDNLHISKILFKQVVLTVSWVSYMDENFFGKYGA
jgi:hypothetical protein